MQYLEDILIILIIALPSYFLWRWVYSKLIKQERKKQIAVWVSTLVLTPIIIRIAFTVFVFSLCYYPTQKFNRAAWLADKEKRYQMSADIVDSKILLGKTKAEVSAVLGQQESISGADKWYYELGIVPGLSIDADHLYIVFKDGKVVMVKQTHG